MTKEMLKRCLNEKKQAFCALEKDVQDAINENKDFQQALNYISGKISWKNNGDVKPMPNYVYRLSPDTPTEPEWEEFNIEYADDGDAKIRVGTGIRDYRWVWVALFRKDFLGIVYSLNGVETLRTSIDAAFGVPVRVRFSK